MAPFAAAPTIAKTIQQCGSLMKMMTSFTFSGSYPLLISSNHGGSHEPDYLEFLSLSSTIQFNPPPLLPWGKMKQDKESEPHCSRSLVYTNMCKHIASIPMQITFGSNQMTQTFNCVYQSMIMNIQNSVECR